MSRVPQIEHRERDTSVGSKVTNKLPSFSRTALFHLAAKTTYHSKGLKMSLAAHKLCLSFWSDLAQVFWNRTQPWLTLICTYSSKHFRNCVSHLDCMSDAICLLDSMSANKAPFCLWQSSSSLLKKQLRIHGINFLISTSHFPLQFPQGYHFKQKMLQLK